MIRKIKILVLSVVVLASVFLLGRPLLSGFSSDDPSKEDFQLLGRIINLIKNHYFEEPKPNETMEGAFKGLVNSLDTLSSYLDVENVEKYGLQREKRLNETGIILYKKEYTHYPQVVGIIKDSPAEKGGLQLGDLVIAIDGESTRTMSMLEANLELKEIQEADVDLRFIRRSQTQEVTITRKVLFEEPVSYTLHKGTSGILKIHHLYPACVSQIREGIIPRIKPHKNPLILDLRNCHEGDINEALKLANLFVKSQEIGYFERRAGEKEILSCAEKPELSNLPLIIWTNQATIGSAEVAAAVLSEFRMAKILGLSTPGLVAKQDFINLEDGSALLLTSGLFTLKSGDKLWEKGLTPDIKIQGRDQSDEMFLKETMKLIPSL